MCVCRAYEASRTYPDLNVTTCHNYEIEYKYQYQCTSAWCQKIIGRHSKSIDMELQRCGWCGGVLKLRERLRVDGTPVKSRAASEFSLYVKEKYATVRTAGTPHKEAMRKIADSWKQRKALTVVN
eukprot:jgi/Chlat1/476/Chrsp103S01075